MKRGASGRSGEACAPSLAELQARLQASILAGDDAILPLIPDSSREQKAVLLGVYRRAYGARLAEFLQNDYPKLFDYLGDGPFRDMADSYAKDHPSDTPNARWYGRHLPTFLAKTPPYASLGAIGELALLEKALTDAFDAPDEPVITLDDLRGIPPEAFTDLRLTPQSHTACLELSTNAVAIWLSLDRAEEPPDAITLEQGAQGRAVLVWRQERTPRFRSLQSEESMLWREAAKGTTFGVLCELAATYDDPDAAAGRAAGYLHGWLASGLLRAAEISQLKARRKKARR
jgi:hypothetical protein